ncbi:MAG TPA: GPP34 family phosphoprotein [Streptosporangiaceae bacterium]|nr:GPP34 family phosphoprotein [Streptosporangiaceae bacterium]
MARLTGTGRIADDLYLIAHHEVTGRPFLHPRAVGLGLAGALLAELALPGLIQVWPEAVVVTGRRVPIQDGLVRAVTGQLLDEPDRHPAKDWLQFLARTATRDVAHRLERAGYLAEAWSRRPWRGERWVPVDADCAFAPFYRVRGALDPARQSTVIGTTVAGLAVACGLGSRLAQFGPPGALRHLDESVRQLKPDLRELIAQTQAAVDSAVLSHRV